MKKIIMSVAISCFCLVTFFSGPVSADLNNLVLNADCDGFQISGEARANWYYHQGLIIDYTLNLTADGVPYEVSGEEEILTDSVEYEFIPIEVTGVWEDEICGDVTVEGAIVWVKLSGAVLHTFTLDPVSFYCECAPQDDPCEDCEPCDGKITELTLKYLGLEDAIIRVEMKKCGGVIFEGAVDPLEDFTFTGMDRKGTMGTEITLYVNEEENTKIHTSCSQPIGPGAFFGDFEVISGYSRNGGLLCPEGSDCDDDSDGEIEPDRKCKKDLGKYLKKILGQRCKKSPGKFFKKGSDKHCKKDLGKYFKKGSKKSCGKRHGWRW